MSFLFSLFDIAILAIGIMLVVKHYQGGNWTTPPVLSGIAFILIALPSVLYMIGM